MIVKRVARSGGTSSFERLARYILDHAHDGEKVALARVSNCESEDHAWATREIMATQALNRRAKADKTCHLVVSFPAGEEPTPEQLADIEATLAEAIGLGGHQRISALHGNTGHAHLHVAISKVHPRTYRNVQVLRDYFRLDEACQVLEGRHGLEPDNRISRARRAPRPIRAADLEAHRGEGSLTRWVGEHRVALEALRDGASSWGGFHKALAEHGLVAQQRGAGLVLVAADGSAAVKASSVGRGYGFAALQGRWGPFETSTSRPAQRVNEHRLLQRAPATAELYAAFQRERADALAARRELAERSKAAADAQRAALANWYRERRLLIREGRNLSPATRKLEYRRLAEERRADATAQRKERSAQKTRHAAEHPVLAWGEYLRRRADAGDLRALEVLRSRERKQVRLAKQVLAAADTEAARHVVLDGVKRDTRKNGDVLYRLRDGGVVRDSAREIQLDEPTPAAAFAALLLAQQRFPGSPLVVAGSEAFRSQVVQAAASHGLDVTFDDPSLDAERARLRAQSSRETQDAALAAFVGARNEVAKRVPNVLRHRPWTPGDAGEALYRGRRQIEGMEVVLLERGGEVLVKPVSSAQAAKASTMPIGKTVMIDTQGRFRDDDRSTER